MSDNLFKAEKAKYHSGRMNVSVRNLSKVVKQIRKLENGGETVIKRTVSDFNSRAPGWVKSGVKKHYGVDDEAIVDAAKGKRRVKTTVKLTGTAVDDMGLLYAGRTLTPTHFDMSPKTRQPNPYKIEATIIKGRRVSLPAGSFLAPASKKRSDAPQIPFQRTADTRLPIEGIRTLSVPQMIDNRAQDTIQAKVDKGMSKRLENHIKQVMK